MIESLKSMANDKKFFDDFSKLATSTFSSMVNMKNELSNIVKEQIKSALKSMDFVTRNEFNALKKMTSDMKLAMDGSKPSANKGKSEAKTAAKKAPAKKAAVKKVVAAKKAAVKKVIAQKTSAKKVVAKKVITKKAPAKKKI